jgi:purine-binding chemotaxis protein CheW
MNDELEAIQSLEGQEAQDEKKSFLIFSVNSIEFGIDIGIIKEINKLQPISTVPNSKPFCKGIINIRGTIVPVIDLGLSSAFLRRNMMKEPA